MQIWVTYEEFARFAARPVAEVREDMILNGWDRRQSRDGQTRTKLPNYVAALYMLHALREEVETSPDQQARALRSALAALQMSAARPLASAA